MTRMDPRMMAEQAATMGAPGPAAQARGQLADFYDGETANQLELARFAHDAGLKSSYENLINIAQRSRKHAETARRHEKLQTVLGHLAGQRAATKPPTLLDQLQSATALPQLPGPDAGMNPMMPPQGSMPSYAEGGTHPGGSALVGEEGPEVVDLPEGSTVHPNPQTVAGGGNPYLMVIRSLLDLLEQGQGGMELPAQDGQGMPAYAYGTPNVQRGGMGGMIQRAAGNLPGRPGSPGQWTPGQFGRQDFLDESGQFNANHGLQGLQIRNAEAGNYNPLGSEAAAQISKQAILGGMGARQAQAGNMADIYAQGDPSFRAFARLQAQANTQSEGARAYEQARADQVASAQNFGRNVYMGQQGAVTRKDPREPNPLAQVGGQVLGAGLGALTGGFGGAAMGGLLSGGNSWQPPQDDPAWTYTPPARRG